MVIGGGFFGTPVSASFIGSSTPDLVVSTMVGGTPRLVFVDGDKVGAAGSSLRSIEGLEDSRVHASRHVHGHLATCDATLGHQQGRIRRHRRRRHELFSVSGHRYASSFCTSKCVGHMGSSRYWARAQKPIAMSRVDGEMVLLDTTTGKYFGLNGVALSSGTFWRTLEASQISHRPCASSTPSRWTTAERTSRRYCMTFATRGWPSRIAP